MATIAVVPWSPLARGLLARGWDEATYRTETDEFGRKLYAGAAEADRTSIGRSSPRASSGSS